MRISDWRSDVCSSDLRSDASPSLATLSLTPGYAAPERMTGGEPTTLVDIYSLGKILAFLVDGAECVPELEAIIAKATQADPGKRYETPQLLSEDVAAWLAHRPGSAFGGGRRCSPSEFDRRKRGAGGFVSPALLGV